MELTKKVFRTEEAKRAYYDKRNELRRTEEFRAKRRATRDLVKNREYCRDYYERNKERELQRRKDYRNDPKNVQIIKDRSREQYLKSGKAKGLEAIKNLTDNYIKNLFTSKGNLKCKDLPKEMIEAKRLELLIRRQVLDEMTPQQRKKLYKERYLAKNPNAGKDYRNANKERLKEAAKLWKQKNKEHVREMQNLWRKENKERLRALERERYHKNQEKFVEKNRKFREKNRDKLRIKSKEFYAKNKEEINAKRRNITPEQREHINALARIATRKRKLLKKEKQNEQRN